MGIRFFCENGHKIHVKAYLAGKRGICPTCGVKVDIPAASGDPVETASAESPRQPSQPVAERHWFVQTPTGEQYGPATESIFSEWLREGRVSAACLVWREGWDGWRPAGQVLPLAPAPDEWHGPADVERTAVELPTAVPQIAAEPARLPLRRARRRSSQKLVYALVAACLLLLVPLIYVVTVNS